VGKPKPVLNPSVAMSRVQSSVRERGGGDSAAEEERGRGGSAAVLELKDGGADSDAVGRTAAEDTPPKAFSAGVRKFLEVKRVAVDRWSLAARPTTEGAAAEKAHQPLLRLGRPRDLWAPAIERFHEAPATELSIPKVSRHRRYQPKP
jgi:hypothetical protein